MFPALSLANWMRRHTNAPIRSSSIGGKQSLSRSPLASIDSRFLTWRRAGNIRSRAKIHLFGIFQPCLSSLTVNIPAERSAKRSVASATMSVLGCSSRRSEVRFWLALEKPESGGKYQRIGSSNLCIHERPIKKAHLLRCACPARSNVPPRVRLRLARPERGRRTGLRAPSI